MPTGVSLSVRVLDADTPISAADLDRFFGAESWTPARRQRLATCPRIAVACGPRLVGLVVYESLGSEVRVHEFGLAPQAPCGPRHVAGVALDALELSCLAAGVRRLVMTSRALVAGRALWERGFWRIDEGCAGSWLEKTFRRFPTEDGGNFWDSGSCSPP